MSHAGHKVDWCLQKARKELEKGGKHRGLLIVTKDEQKIFGHIKKAEHHLKAAIDFSKTGYSDWSVSAFFYSIYQCFLAISLKFGYESGNQECTFALIESLIEEKKIGLDKNLFDKVTTLEVQKGKVEQTGTEIREEYQYGTKLSIDESLFEELLDIAKRVLSQTKEIIEMP